MTEMENADLLNDEEVKRWYVVNTYSGHENRVKDNLEKRVESMGIQDCLFRILVAEEPEIEIKGNKKIEKMHNLFPGYVFVEMKMTDEAWYVVRNTPGVTGFIGSSGKGAKPTPLQPYEVDNVLRSMGMSRLEMDNDLEVGTKVKIVEGPFAGMFGTIETLDTENQTLTIVIDLFGQETSVEAELSQIEKA